MKTGCDHVYHAARDRACLALLALTILAACLPHASSAPSSHDSSLQELYGRIVHPSEPADTSLEQIVTTPFQEQFFRRGGEEEDECTTKDGRRRCGPLCGTCNVGECCRGDDMTCGKGPAFCQNLCTPQFSIGTCPSSGKLNTLYKWWETDGPGAPSAGRILVPAGFPTMTFIKPKPTPAPLNPNILTPNKMLPVGAACNKTAATPWGGCESSCCLSGKCQLCDKCELPGRSTKCKWCIANNKTVSAKGCLLLGDTCTLKPGLAGVHPSSHCKTGCCKYGKCQWCETCMYQCKCGTMGYPLNPLGRCVTKTTTRSKTRTTTKKVITTKKAVVPPPITGGGPGSGAVIYSCSRPGVLALTFDDGPWLYTSALLDVLASRGAKATFFMNGQNYGNIYDRADVVRRMRNEGHCVASHGFNHINMPSYDYGTQVNNLQQMDNAIANIIGMRPRFFRPPYGAYDGTTVSAARDTGHDLVIWNIDSNDWSVHNVDAEMNQFYVIGGADRGSQSFISLEHDVYQDTAEGLAARVIDYVQGQGWQVVDMGTCWTGSLNGCYQ